MTAPLLVLIGDEDDPCLQAGLFLKATVPASGLAVLPKAGHTLNLEEPELFNRLLGEFLAQVEAGRWGPRDPRPVDRHHDPDEVKGSSHGPADA